MRMKKYVVLLLALVLLLPCTACGKTDTLEDVHEDIRRFGDTDSKEPLRICMDIQNFTSDSMSYQPIKEFLSEVKRISGVEDMVIEYIPTDYGSPGIQADTSVRIAAVDRLRVEILSGYGPDVFIMSYHFFVKPDGYDLDSGAVLFKYPQKAMENGLFLPLDDYMENKTQYAEWDAFPKAVMEAGRNAEGQQIIPITYTFPILVYPHAQDIPISDRLLSWQDMLTDPELSPYATDLVNCYDYEMEQDGSRFRSLQQYLEFILGDLADYENESLSFTEAELLQRVNELLALNREGVPVDSDNTEEMLVGYNLSKYNDQPFTLMPLYSDDGGITARIQNYAAINRNTKRPDDSYTVIDVLMSTQAQKNYSIYLEHLYRSQGLPMNNNLFRQDTPLQHPNNYYLRTENFTEWSKVRSQITNAHFESEIELILYEMLSSCLHADKNADHDRTVEEIVHDAYVNIQRRVRE